MEKVGPTKSGLPQLGEGKDTSVAPSPSFD